jgi:hypothetical protein
MTEPPHSGVGDTPPKLDGLEKAQRRWILGVDRSVRAVMTLFFLLLLATSLLYVVRLRRAVASRARSRVRRRRVAIATYSRRARLRHSQ